MSKKMSRTPGPLETLEQISGYTDLYCMSIKEKPQNGRRTYRWGVHYVSKENEYLGCF